jgi:hypothetical protein
MRYKALNRSLDTKLKIKKAITIFNRVTFGKKNVIKDIKSNKIIKEFNTLKETSVYLGC